MQIHGNLTVLFFWQSDIMFVTKKVISKNQHGKIFLDLVCKHKNDNDNINNKYIIIIHTIVKICQYVHYYHFYNY